MRQHSDHSQAINVVVISATSVDEFFDRAALARGSCSLSINLV